MEKPLAVLLICMPFSSFANNDIFSDSYEKRAFCKQFKRLGNHEIMAMVLHEAPANYRSKKFKKQLAEEPDQNAKLAMIYSAFCK